MRRFPGLLGDDWRGDDCRLLLPGTELIGIAAGESENPEKNIPRAVRQVFWRILLFYVFAILIISLIIPYTDPSLLRNDVKTSASARSRWSSSTRVCSQPRR